MKDHLPPFERLLQIYPVEKREGFSKIGLAYREELTNPHGHFHGGAIAAFVDMAVVQGLLTLPITGPFPTVELSVRFKHSSQSPEIFAEARPKQLKGKLFKTEVRIIDNRGKVIAEAEVKSFVLDWKQTEAQLQSK